MAALHDVGEFWSRLKPPEKIAIGVFGIGIVAYLVYRARQGSGNQPITFAAAPTPAGSGIPQDTGGSSAPSGGTSFNPSDYTSAITSAISTQAAADAANQQALINSFAGQSADYQSQINTLINANQAQAMQLAALSEGQNPSSAIQHPSVHAAAHHAGAAAPKTKVVAHHNAQHHPVSTAHPNARNKTSEVLSVHNAANTAHAHMSRVPNVFPTVAATSARRAFQSGHTYAPQSTARAARGSIYTQRVARGTIITRRQRTA